MTSSARTSGAWSMAANTASEKQAMASSATKEAREKWMPCHSTAPISCGRPAPTFCAMSTPT